MMYRENFVAVIKCNGSVLRETNGCVRLPFGSQYSVLLKNLDSRKAVVDVSVDGDNVCGNDRIIVPPNDSVELKGKMRGGKVRHKFKFIERTKEISNYRGSRADDGLIRVEYWFEQRYREPEPYPAPLPWLWYNDTYPVKAERCDGPFSDFSDIKYSGFDNSGTSVMYSCSLGNSTNFNNSQKIKSSKRAPKTDIGITVQGSKTKQNFVNGYTKTLESQSSVIVIQLKGKTKQGGKLRKEITTRTKLRCPTCGRRSKSYAKWCHNCGTNLE